MDGPANLMIIVGVWLLEGPVAVEKVEKQIAEGLLSYRRFRQKVDYTPAGIYWRDDPNFDLAHHIKRARLPGRGGKQALQLFVGDLASEPLDPNHPLWTVHIVEKYEGGAAVVLRFHHAIADGIALMGVTMAMVDGPTHKSSGAALADEDEGWLQNLMAPVVAAINAGTQASTSTLRSTFELARHPLRTAAGKAFLDMLGVFAEFETNLRRERQMEGISAAKLRGVYKGRPPAIDAAQVAALKSEGLGATEIAKRMGVGRASVYRVLRP